MQTRIGSRPSRRDNNGMAHCIPNSIVVVKD